MPPTDIHSKAEFEAALKKTPNQLIVIDVRFLFLLLFGNYSSDALSYSLVILHPVSCNVVWVS
jgi:hypothetical protein